MKHTIWEGFELSIFQFIVGVILAIIVGAVIIGGISRIGSFTGFLAPFMALIYISSAAAIILNNFHNIFDSFGLIIQMAFYPPATVAGTTGGILITMLWGIKRGLYSNEAGQGSAAIAHSTAKTKYSVREGTVAMLGPYIDTLIICTMTALVIISTDTWMHTEFYVKISASSLDEFNSAINSGFYQGRELLNSSLLTTLAFKNGLSFLFSFGDKIVTISVLLFAISTAISWSFYGNRSAVYLFGEKAIKPYLYTYVLFVFIGGIAELETIWAFGDACLGMMTFPNLISIILLIGTTKLITKEYFSSDHVPYRKK
jgi:AGCS family alanine or glycine:cation symporter